MKVLSLQPNHEFKPGLPLPFSKLQPYCKSESLKRTKKVDWKTLLHQRLRVTSSCRWLSRGSGAIYYRAHLQPLSLSLEALHQELRSS